MSKHEDGFNGPVDVTAQPEFPSDFLLILSLYVFLSPSLSRFVCLTETVVIPLAMAVAQTSLPFFRFLYCPLRSTSYEFRVSSVPCRVRRDGGRT